MKGLSVMALLVLAVVVALLAFEGVSYCIDLINQKSYFTPILGIGLMGVILFGFVQIARLIVRKLR